MGNETMITDLVNQNDQKFKEIQFNNVKLMVLRGESKQVVSDYIVKYFNRFQDQESKQLLITFSNSKL